MNEDNKQARNLARTALSSKEYDSEIKPDTNEPSTKGSVKNPFKKLKNKWKKLSKKGRAIVIAVSILVLGGIGFGIYALISGEDSVINIVSQEPEPEVPITEASKVTGEQVNPKVNDRFTTGIIIENSPDARPQSGMQEADIVYEAIAEGGITRFLALWHDEESDKIGPVRSARPYFLDWIRPWDAGFAHVGGSPKALQQIGPLGVKDLDQFFNSGAYYRANNRFAPHNVYTSTDKLDALEKDKGYDKNDGTGFERAEEKGKVGTISAEKISMDVSSANYNSAWSFVESRNSYKRAMAGRKHVDAETAKQLEYDVVIGLVMNKSLASDGSHTVYDTTGNGAAFIYQNGKVKKGKWKKSSREAQFTFVDSEGETILLNPGKTWITIASASSQISHKAAPKPKVETN